MGVSASGRARSDTGPGVGGGDKKATFFCTSLFVPVAVLVVPFVVLRELRPAESGSGRDRRGSAGSSLLRMLAMSSVCSGGGNGDTAMGVGVAEEWTDSEDDGSSMGGNGRTDKSGRGLESTVLGVEVARCGGHSGRAGRGGIFSLYKSLSLSFSFESPRLMRLRNAFMAHIQSLVLCSAPVWKFSSRQGLRRGKRNVDTTPATETWWDTVVVIL